ncbi:hypothetical protein [uncultured Ruegeria sp.]|uniref:hypothetical protein n=1 Tax=uncultured Ruegeria sp. TaxID=259304 RepID=UPI002603B551|nr:hypothetical protein [uncultured Ruegeria sp.]
MGMRVAKRSLAGGEINEDLWYSSDILQVVNGAAEIRNFIVRPQGGIERIPGTEFIAKAKTNGAIRLGTFKASRAASYLVEYQDQIARVRKADDAAAFEEVATPYVDDDLIFLQMAQSNDVQWIFSGKRVKELQRSEQSPGVFSFDLVDAAVRNGPFLDQNFDTSLTITASAVSGGGITLTASRALFQAGHVGAYFKIQEDDFSQTGRWAAGEAVSVNDTARYNGNVYRCTRGGTTTGNPPGHLEGRQADSVKSNAVVWQYLHSGYGIVRITSFTNSTTVTANVVLRLPERALSGVSKWSEGAWSDVNGYPLAGALYKRALWAGGSAKQPSVIWKSANDGFDDWELGVKDDSALARGLYGEESSAVRWLTPAKVLAIGTDGPEWLARPDQSGDVARVNNLITETATNQGTSEIPGIAVNGSIIFVDASLTELRGMTYDFRKDDWDEKHYSLFASHILGQGVVQMVFQRRPWPVFWCLLANGRLGGLTFVPEQNVLAWHQHNMGGFVRSIALSPVDGGKRETLFLAVDRTVDGVTEVHIERMFDRFRPERGQSIKDARYLFGAKVFNEAAPTGVFSGLEHLEGQQVIALVDGRSHPPITVTGGQVTLNFPGQHVVIGRAYTSSFKLLPFDLGIREDFQTSRDPSIRDVAIAFRASLGGEVVMDGKSEAVWRLGDSPLDQAPELRSGPEQVDPPSSEGSQLEYRNSTAWPVHVTGIFPEYEI